MKITKKVLVRSLVVSLCAIVAIMLTPVYLKNGGFYFDDSGLNVEDLRFKSANRLKFRIYNESTRKGNVVLWLRHKRKNVCLWVFQMYSETHIDFTANCPGMRGKDYVINYEWAASNPRLASSAVRLGTVKDFF